MPRFPDVDDLVSSTISRDFLNATAGLDARSIALDVLDRVGELKRSAFSEYDRYNKANAIGYRLCVATPGPAIQLLFLADLAEHRLEGEKRQLHSSRPSSLSMCCCRVNSNAIGQLTQSHR